MLAEMEELEIDNLHNFYNCSHKSCKQFSEKEEARQKLLKKRMHHSWLEGKTFRTAKPQGFGGRYSQIKVAMSHSTWKKDRL